jgi:phasin
VWAAYWPLSVWLLTLEKAAKQYGEASRSSTEPRAAKERAAGQEERSMASDAFIKPEIPDSVRELVKASIEQARRAFDTFAESSEKVWKSFEDTSASARASLQSLNAKIAEITRANAEANFALAAKLAESRDINQAMELQSKHAQAQMEAFARQLEEIRDLATQLIQDAKSAVASSRSASSASSPFSASGESAIHRGPSSFTPRGGSSSGSSW